MVPHRKILRAIMLAAHASAVPDETRQNLCEKYCVKFPRDTAAFLKTQVLDFLSPEVEALLMSKDPTKVDYAPELMAAQELGIRILSITPAGLTIQLPEKITAIRRQEPLRICIESMLLCNIPNATIVSDLQRMYGRDFFEDDLVLFADLFMDRDFAKGDPWIEYAQCIGLAEATFKFTLMHAPTEYARWKLGVPVSLDSEKILDRMISDSYFALQQMKAENPQPTQADIPMIKMERDTILKSLDRRMKLKEATMASGSKDGENIVEMMGKIVLKYEKTETPLASELA